MILLFKKKARKSAVRFIVYSIYLILCFQCLFILNLITLNSERFAAYILVNLLVSGTILFVSLIMIPSGFLNRNNSDSEHVRLNTSYLLCIWITISFLLTFIYSYLIGEFKISKVILASLIINLGGIIIMTLPVGNFRQIITIESRKNGPVLKSSDIITLYGKAKAQVLTIRGEDLIYIKCSENYCEIKYLKNNEISIKYFRTPIKELDQQIVFRGIERVHKSFIINLKHVNHFIGNVNNTKAVLGDFGDEIPIARSKRNKVIDIHRNLNLVA